MSGYRFESEHGDKSRGVVVTLVVDDLTLVVDPELGGSVRSLLFGDTEILRSAPKDCDDPVACAAFPMIPFSGRIDQGVFSFSGRQVALAKNMPPEPHAIHGYGWQLNWLVGEQSATSIRLGMKYIESDWPWSFDATQSFELKQDRLDVILSITNTSPEVMPVGLGWHPFFPKQDAELTIDAAKIWLNGPDKIPTRGVEQTIVDSLRRTVPVADLDLDNAFSDVRAPVEIYWPKRKLGLTIHSSEQYPHAVVYTPPLEEFFCVEPVSHIPNSINSSLADAVTGARTVGPSESLEARTSLLISQH